MMSRHILFAIFTGVAGSETTTSSIKGYESNFTEQEDCFPVDSMVSMASGDWTAIDNLTRWQAMKSPVISSPPGRLSSSEFIVEAHPDPHGSRFFEYIELQHERSRPQGNWPPLKISSGHFLFVKKVRSWRDADFVPAADVMVGDGLLVEDSSSPESLVLSKVTKVTRVLALGKSSPQTTSGRLIVNGVAVSSYAMLSGGIDWWQTFPELLRPSIEAMLWFTDLFAVATLHRVMFPVEMLPTLVPHIDISGALIRLGGIFSIF